MPNDQWTAFPIVPEGAPDPHPFPQCEVSYPYKNQENFLLGYTLRIVKNGAKVVLPFCYCHDKNGGKDWRFKRWEPPLPLYGLHKLKSATSVIVVEGEKCADAMQTICPPGCVALSWPGGSNAVALVDWEPLRKRKILLWPDHDISGYRAMAWISRKLASAAEIKIFRPPQDKPDKWDCADAILEDKWDQKKTFEFIRANIITENDLSKIIERLSTPNTTPADPNEAPFAFLGYNRGRYFYHPTGTEQVAAVSASEHSANTLFSIAPKGYWESHFASKIGIDWKSAINWLMQESHSRGVYDVMRVRGCGVWMDEQRTVVHDVQSLLVDGKKTALSKIKSSRIYERDIKRNIIDAEPLPFKEAQRVLEICASLVWDDPLSAYMLAGWVVLAPICGALTWRPHIQITGAAGTGKTYVVDHIIKPLLGDAAAYTTVGTTAAGILQNLKSSAFPVLLDEAESKTQHSSQVIQAILDLMRQASSDSEARTLKGTQNGSGLQYCIRSCFCLSSVGISVDEEADKGRVSILSLAHDQHEDKRERFQKLHEDIISMLKKSWCSGFRARSIVSLKTILQNIGVFSEVAAIKLGNQRRGDQVGALLGAAFSLVSEAPATKENAEDFVSSWSWRGHQVVQHETDETRCLQAILQNTISVNSPDKHFDISVSEIVSWVARKSVDWSDGSPPLSVSDFDLVLRRNGLRVDEEKGKLLISSSNPLLKRSLNNTQWSKNWLFSLLRIPGAVEYSSCRFQPGVITRAAGIPLALVLE